MCIVDLCTASLFVDSKDIVGSVNLFSVRNVI